MTEGPSCFYGAVTVGASLVFPTKWIIALFKITQASGALKCGVISLTRGPWGSGEGSGHGADIQGQILKG